MKYTLLRNSLLFLAILICETQGSLSCLGGDYFFKRKQRGLSTQFIKHDLTQ